MLRETSTGAVAKNHGTRNVYAAALPEQLLPLDVTPDRVRDDTIVQRVSKNSLDV